MPNRCTICDHKRATYIDRLIGQDRSLLSISKEVGVSYDALRRHSANGHVASWQARTPVAAPSGPTVLTGAVIDGPIEDTSTGIIYPDEASWLQSIADRLGMDVDALTTHYREGHHLAHQHG
jgi:hypothetical protein